MASGCDDDFEHGSIPALRQAKVEFQELSVASMKKRWPQINFEGILGGIHEPECGYLDARASCQGVVDAFIAEGGKYRQAAVSSQGLEQAPLRRLTLSDGSGLRADHYVFACGPWLGQLFSNAIANLIAPTKQDVLFFGTPPGDPRFSDSHLPVWGDHRDHFFYGIPGGERRGFKVADDTRGPAFNPSNGERIVNPEAVNHVREYLAFRFPALKDAPLVESRVCQYEQTSDSEFILDRHPKLDNVWIVGGGSGHGFKHGPAIGEMMATLILKDGEPDRMWRLDRFRNTKALSS